MKFQKIMSEVLKSTDFNKMVKIIQILENRGEITPKEAENITGKSSATVRRYLKMLVGTSFVEVEGSTNNIIYKVKLK